MAADAETAGGGLGDPVGASAVFGVEAGPLATAEAEGREGSDAGAAGTAGKAALAGTTMAVGAGASGVCLLHAASALIARVDVRSAIRFIPCSVRRIGRRPLLDAT